MAVDDSRGAGPAVLGDDERRLNELGYKQELERSMGGFANFAVSFTIISVLSGALTLYGTGINYGGPISQSIGWPIVSVFVIVVAASMAELASAYPTAGGLYWWASRLGGPAWGWFTGWLNLIGQVAITAGIDYGAATFATALLGLLFGIDTGVGTILAVYALILALHAALNIFGVRLVARLNDVSAYWHVIGVVVFALVLIVVPNQHQSVSFVFTETVNNSGFSSGLFAFVFLLGFLQAQYTYTGYDASAHMSEETRNASQAAARGVLMSVVVSAIAGYVLIMALTFAIQDLGAVTEAGGTAVIEILTQALGEGGAEVLLFIAVAAQLFCGMSAVTSASRMLYAFSRDRAVPGSAVWSKLNGRRVPANAVLLICGLAFMLAVPSLWNITAYVAITSIATIALYLAYILPIYLRYRAGDSFDSGPWTLGRRHKPLNLIAMAWVAFICVLFLLPITPTGIPGNADFDLNTVNYAPITVGITMLVVGGWWLASAHKWFRGPVRNLDDDPVVTP